LRDVKPKGIADAVNCTDFAQQLEKIGGKETEKFDLIFAILTELQSRQASLEESVRSLKAQFCAPQSPGASSGTSMAPQLSGQFAGNMNGNGQFSPSGQQNFVPTGPNISAQQPMQFAGVMQPDGSQAIFTPVPQMVLMQSPTNSTMPYAVPQMMSPAGGMSMNAQMGMSFMGQTPFGGEVGNANSNMKVGDELKGEQMPGKVVDADPDSGGQQMKISEE